MVQPRWVPPRGAGARVPGETSWTATSPRPPSRRHRAGQAIYVGAEQSLQVPRSSYPGPIHGASTSPWSAPCCPQRSTEERKFCGTAATALRRDGGPSAVTGGFKSPSDLARNPLRRWRNERSQRNQRRCAGSVSGVSPRYDTSNQKHYAPTLRTAPPGGATARTAHVALALLLPLCS